MTLLWLIAGGALGAVAATFVIGQTTRRRVTTTGGAGVLTSTNSADELAASNARADRLQSALDAMPYGVIVADHQGQVLVRNRQTPLPFFSWLQLD